MKTFVISLILIVLAGVVGFVGFKYLQRSAPPTTNTSTTQTDTVTGLLMSGKGDDYSYIVLTDGGKTVGIASQKIDLSQYVNKKVEITGSYSGTTLYAYTVKEVQ